MERRNFCRYVVLGSALDVLVVGRSSSNATVHNSSQSKRHYRWVVLYWMPYDNDLSSFGEPIIEMLLRGTKNSGALVVVQSHYFGERKMRRRILSNGVIQEINIAAEDSSSILSFSSYLDWAYRTFEAKHWAIIVVGHGGKLNQISPDNHVSTSQMRTWMRIEQFSFAVSQFNQATNKGVELLFFQNCNKGTLEVIYETRDCARYTLASQVLLGAPNYYYESFLKRLNEPSVKGREAAITIMESERPNMYYTLTLIDNRAVKILPGKLSRLVQIFLNNLPPVVNLSTFPSINYFDEQYYDVLALFKSLSKNNNQADKAFTEFAEFLKSSVIAYYKTGGELYGSRHFRNLENLCGLSMYLPETREVASRYSSLALYQNVALVSLYKKIFIN